MTDLERFRCYFCKYYIDEISVDEYVICVPRQSNCCTFRANLKAIFNYAEQKHLSVADICALLNMAEQENCNLSW